KSGHNVFANGSGEPSKLLRQAIAGIGATTKEAFAIFAPNANSYRRYQSMYAPRSTDWGINNRTTGLRIPPSDSAGRRIEHRFAGADANPYLVLACILAGALHGIENKMNCDDALVGNAFAQRAQSLPISWDRGLQSFEAATILPNYLGKSFWETFLKVRR